MGHLPENYGGTVLSSTEVVCVNPTLERTLTLKGGASTQIIAEHEHDGGTTCVQVEGGGRQEGDLKVGDVWDQAALMSRPPSPPESGTTTPVLRIPPCPLRLRPLVPPPNYGVARNGTIFRSAYPQDRNLDFLKLLGIRTLLCLVESEPSKAYSYWIRGHRIARHRVDIAANKDGKVKTTWDSLCEALLIVLDAAHYPLYIHCNQGKHRTGCVIACLRKIQRWPIEDVLAEYHVYADPKARPGDIDLIRAFDPQAVFEYAKRHGRLDELKRTDSVIADIDVLAEALADMPPYCDDIDVSMASNASTFSDDSLEMTLPIHYPAPPPQDTKAPRPSLQRTTSQLQAVDSTIATAAAEDTILVDPVLHAVGATTSVVELSDDMLSPPPETASMKVLGEQPPQALC